MTKRSDITDKPSTEESYYKGSGKNEVLPMDMSKKAATDYIKMAVYTFKLKGMAKGQQRFTSATRDNMIENLSKLRMMCCQADSGKRGEGVDWDEWEFVLSHIAVGTMCLWLSGKLDMIEVDEL